jgi:hypothetical protein
LWISRYKSVVLFKLLCRTFRFKKYLQRIMFKCYELYICRNGSTLINLKNFLIQKISAKNMFKMYRSLYKHQWIHIKNPAELFANAASDQNPTRTSK